MQANIRIMLDKKMETLQVQSSFKSTKRKIVNDTVDCINMTPEEFESWVAKGYIPRKTHNRIVSKLSREIVFSILDSTDTNMNLAALHEVSTNIIRHIRQGKSYSKYFSEHKKSSV